MAVAGPAVSARRSRLPAASRRRQLLDVALETFARSGLEATTMDDIAHAAGVTKPLLYQHFKSKRALFLELLDDVVERLIEALTTAAQSAPGPRQQVEAGFVAYFHFVLHNESAIRLLLDSALPHDVELAEAMRRVDDTIAQAIAPLINADIEAEHQRVLAAAVVGMAIGVTPGLASFPAGAGSVRVERRPRHRGRSPRKACRRVRLGRAPTGPARLLRAAPRLAPGGSGPSPPFVLSGSVASWSSAEELVPRVLIGRGVPELGDAPVAEMEDVGLLGPGRAALAGAR